MFNKWKKQVIGENQMLIGDEVVDIPVLYVEEMEKLIEKAPQIFVSIIRAYASALSDRGNETVLLAAVSVAMTEFTQLMAHMIGKDYDELKKIVKPTDVIKFFKKVWELNEWDELVKNLTAIPGMIKANKTIKPKDA